MLLHGVALAAAALIFPGQTAAQSYVRAVRPGYAPVPGYSLSRPATSLTPLMALPALAPLAPPPGLMSVPAAPKVSVGGALAPLDYSHLLRARLWSGAGSGQAPSVDLSALLGPARQQGRYRGTCAAFAAAGLGESLIKAVRGEDFKISEQYLYYSAKRDFLDSPELQVYKTIDGLAGFVAVEALQGPLLAGEHWPYSEMPPGAVAGARRLLSVDLPALRLSRRDDFERFTGTPPKDTAKRLRRDLSFTPVAIARGRIKDYLASEGKPVVFNIMVYFDAVDQKTGRLRDPTDEERRLCRESGRGCGGHTVLITGYDAAAGEYIFRNSWGPDWGAGGYGRLSESAVLDDCEMCGHLQDLEALAEGDRTMVVNGSHAWSADLR